jgi:hypothetical protein
MAAELLVPFPYTEGGNQFFSEPLCASSSLLASPDDPSPVGRQARLDLIWDSVGCLSNQRQGLRNTQTLAGVAIPVRFDLRSLSVTVVLQCTDYWPK